MNSVNALRLALAAAVLISHSVKFLGVEGDPVGRFTGTGVDLGTMAVDGFFIVSGFLITRSYQTAPSLPRFLWRRCLRILPAFWVCLIVTAAVFAPLASLLEHGRPGSFRLTGPDSALSYVTSNATLLIRQQTITGLLGGGPFNGSLHTLFYEFLCYLLVGVLGALAVLRTRPSLVLGLVGCWWGLAASELASGNALTAGHPARELLLRFGLMFVFGAAMHLYGRLVPLRLSLACGAALLLLGSLVWAEAYLLLAPAALGYLLLFIGTSRGLARVGAHRDLSYGLYVYAWPVQALLVLAGVGAWGPVPYIAAALVVALSLAWVSWTVVESPALALKSWSPSPARVRLPYRSAREGKHTTRPYPGPTGS